MTEVKKEYLDIKRIYFSVYPPSIYDQPRPGVPASYEEVFHPDEIRNAGKATYVKRNYAMIDRSEYCVVYYDEAYRVPNGRRKSIYLSQPKRNSGTKVAFDYATQKKKDLVNVFERINKI